MTDITDYMQTSLTTSQGTFSLSRYPLRKHEQLRAWDAADELVLEHVATLNTDAANSSPKVLIINGQFGALGVALHAFTPTLVGDSFIAQQAIEYNLAQNNLTDLPFLNSLDPLSGPYDIVIIKVQKSLAQLEEQLYKLHQHLHDNSIIIGCAMVKMIHNSNIQLFENIIGPTKTSLAKKKARLIFSNFNKGISRKPNPYPQSFTLEDIDWKILNHANVFSRAKLDIGCRFFIEHIPSSKASRNIIDLGCGNGIVGMVAARNNPNATIHFYDESYMAVASAEFNFQQVFGPCRTANFNVADCLGSAAEDSVDLILNNPPFHQQNAIGDFIAWQMFSQSYRVLASTGELWVIGNTHLGYAQKLKKLFGNCQKVVSNSKFEILRAVK